MVISTAPAVLLRHLSVAAALLAAGPALAQESCTIYTVQSGDTLDAIAARAVSEGGVQLLVSANADVLAGANAVTAGMRLRIPCPDGSLPALDAAGAGSGGATTAAAAPSALPPIRFLTGGNFAPFVDDRMPEGGMFNEMIATALRAGDPVLDHTTVSIFDWEAHLTALLPTTAFDVGYPWHMPDCTRVDSLSEANRIRCTDYDASQPFFEAVIDYYVLAGSPFEGATSIADLSGTRICRPSGWFTFDMEERGLVEPNVVLVPGAIPTSCWRELQAGTVDIVTYDALTAEGDLHRLGIADKVVVLPQLTSIATMHALAPKSHPNGRAYLDILDRGLAQIRTDGTWFAIVSKHLGAYEASLRQDN